MVYAISALKVDIMEIDSAHYAEMAREMKDTGSFLELKNRTVDDYLDKPPLIFWLSSLMFTLFGTSGFTFRLPAILASLLGFYSVFRFTKLHYGLESGLLAGMILLSSQAYFLYNQNFLTDTLLANFAIFSVWQLSEYLVKRKWYFFLGAFFGLAMAMLSKGPLGLMVPVCGFAVHLIYRREWSNIFRWEWLIGLVVILVILSPMMIGLYRQFGRTGLQFFFWTQSFGRLTGQSHWHNDSTPFFFVHTILWFLLPWSFLFLYGFLQNLFSMSRFSKYTEKVPELITTGGFLLSFLALSASRYKLPQYVLVLLPFAAVIASSAFIKLTGTPGVLVKKKIIIGLHHLISAVYLAGAIAVISFFFPQKNPIPWLILTVGVITFLYLLLSPKTVRYRLVFPIAVIAVIANLVLALYFYPGLMKYQPGKQMAADFLIIHPEPAGHLYGFRYHSPALDFHLGYAPPVINERKLERLLAKQGQVWIVTDNNGKNQLTNRLVATQKVFEHYPVQALTIKFLNHNTRDEVLGSTFLLKLVR
jgi:4-amino-4-deoxy-L-arabinose transferase-like glycosyltransferase